MRKRNKGERKSEKKGIQKRSLSEGKKKRVRQAPVGCHSELVIG
jgi:hypothetical protein